MVLGSLVPIVLWLQWFSGSSSSLVPVVSLVLWFQCFSGSNGSWFFGSNSSLVAVVLWFQ